jgi:hypothetical protein
LTSSDELPSSKIAPGGATRLANEIPHHMWPPTSSAAARSIRRRTEPSIKRWNTGRLMRAEWGGKRALLDRAVVMLARLTATRLATNPITILSTYRSSSSCDPRIDFGPGGRFYPQLA